MVAVFWPSPLRGKVPLVSVPLLLVLLSIGNPAQAEPLTRGETAAIDRLLAEEQAATSVPGIALIVRREGAVVYRRSIGKDGKGVRFEPSTPIWLGSLSKSFTAIAVMQLVTAHAVDLDQPVERYLPDFRMQDGRGSSITVRNLLEHRSGLTDANMPDWTHPWPDTYAEVTRRVHQVRVLSSAPGTRTAYHNGNYMILADLVEHVSREAFESYLKRHVFGPLGLRSAIAVSRLNAAPASVPPGYVLVLGHPLAVHPPGMFIGGAGGVIASADDLSKWVEAFAGSARRPEMDKLLPRGVLAGLLRPNSNAPYVYNYGWVLRQPHTALIEHSGGLPTFAAHAAFSADDSLNIAVTTNASLGNAAWSQIGQDMADGVVEILAHKPVTTVPTTRIGAGVDAIALVITALLAAMAPLLIRRRRWQARIRSAQGWRRNWVWFRASLVPITIIALVFVALPVLVGLVESWSWFWLWFTSPVVTTCLWTIALVAAIVVIQRWRAMRTPDNHHPARLLGPETYDPPNTASPSPQLER